MHMDRPDNLKKILGHHINYLSNWPLMCHPWFLTRKASKLTFICFQHQVLNTLQGLDNWSWIQINVSFEAFLVHVHLKTDKVDLKKKDHREKKNFCIFFQSTHQVGMKNVVKCYKDFFGYFNALKTHCTVMRFGYF